MVQMSGRHDFLLFNSNEIRGEQLAQQVEEMARLLDNLKLTLIGHSQGGPTIRYVAGIMPNKVASLTSVSGTHKAHLLPVSFECRWYCLRFSYSAVVNFSQERLHGHKDLIKSYPHDAF